VTLAVEPEVLVRQLPYVIALDSLRSWAQTLDGCDLTPAVAAWWRSPNRFDPTTFSYGLGHLAALGPDDSIGFAILESMGGEGGGGA
jgi:hypothetical protein